MAINYNKPLLTAVLSSALAIPAISQDTHRTVRRGTTAEPQPSPASVLLDQAEALLAKADYSAAQPILERAVVKDPKSYQAWYDL